MAEGSAHLCRCTIATMAILFIISLGLFIAAWNINTINSIFGLQESGGNAPAPPASHNFTYMNVDVGGGVEISVRLGNWNPPNSSMVVNSTSITYVVLLHGVPEAGELCFRDIIGTMPTTWIYIIPDLRGAGNSSKPPLPEAYAITTMISDLWIVLNQTVKANTSVNLVGVDFGGVLSFAYAHTYPSQVRTLTTVEAAHPYVIQSLLQQYSVQRANFSEILKYMLPEADSAYSSGFASFPILESGMSWWTSRMSEYKTLWSLEGGLEWTSVLNYWRTNLILSPAWNANGAEFNANTTFNWVFNATGQQITATIKMIYGFPSKSYYMLPSAASSSAAYIKKYAPPVYIANGTHWIHHGLTANSTADQIKQNILNA